MTFQSMKKSLIKQGLLDKDGNLTQKGHEYVESVKQKFKENTKPFQWNKEEMIDG